eukprot:COSAG06_NODE_1359_length_9719_cov_14.493971_3_plen_117_part_00
MARSKRQSKPRNDLPPERDSPLVTTSVANILDAIVMRDPQWTWVTDEWKRNDTHTDLLSRIDAHRATIAGEIAKMLDQIVAPPSAEEPQVKTVKVEPSADLEEHESDTVVVSPQSE